MERQTKRVPAQDVARQREFCEKTAELLSVKARQHLAYVDTYGCQQNEADSERIRGYLKSMGYGFTQD